MKLAEKIIDESRYMLKDLENIMRNSEELIKMYTKKANDTSAMPSERDDARMKAYDWKKKLKAQKERYDALKASFKK